MLDVRSAAGSLVSTESGDALYRRLMGDIEPDLLLSTAELDRKYAGEGEGPRKRRMERYRLALLEYLRRFEAHLFAQREGHRSAKTTLRAALEAQAGGDESGASARIDAMA